MVRVTGRARGLLKRVAYVSGALGRYQKVRNRNTLTVVMFHRVLAAGDERWAHAEPRYTMTDDQLEQCIEFFGKHYSLVDLAAVGAAAGGGQALPARALLVTFDDGWADTEEYALPVLRRRRCPAVVFVVSSAVGASHGFWQERIVRAWKGGADPGALASAWRGAPGDADPPPENWQASDSVRRLIARLRPLVPSARLALVEQLEGEAPAGRPELLTHDQLRSLHRSGIAIGAHGVTHEALAEAASGTGELGESKTQLSELLDGEAIEAMSFPHGSYDGKLLRAAEEDFELVFTSDGCLNVLAEGCPPTVLGRIEIPAEAIVGADGEVRPELLALWLFRRSRATVTTL